MNKSDKNSNRIKITQTNHEYLKATQNVLAKVNDSLFLFGRRTLRLSGGVVMTVQWFFYVNALLTG